MTRRLLAAVALAGLVLVSGCSGSDSADDASGGGTTTESTATSAPPSAADNTKKVCTDLNAVNLAFTQKIVALTQRALQEMAADDEAKADATLEEVRALIREHAGNVEALSATATNAELKQVLATLAADLKTADEETLEEVATAAEAKYNAICNR